MLPFVRLFDYGNVAPTKPNIIKLLCSSTSTVVLYSNGELYGFGANSYGVLGGTEQVDNVKLITTNVTNAWLSNSDLLVQKGTSFYFQGNGTLVNSQGNGSTALVDITSYFSAIQLSNIKKIDIRGGYLAILMNDGTLYASGYNGNGQYGNGTTDRFTTPTVVNTNVQDYVGGADASSSFIVKSNQLYGAGWNYAYKLGTDVSSSSVTTYTSSTYPVKTVTSLDTFVAMSNSSHLLYQGVIYFSGNNTNSVSSSTAAAASFLADFKTAAVAGVNGFDMTKIIRCFGGGAGVGQSPFYLTDTGLFACGGNGNGQLGIPDTASQSRYIKASSLDQYVDDYSLIEHAGLCGNSAFVVYDNKIYGVGNPQEGYLYRLPGYVGIQREYVPIAMPY